MEENPYDDRAKVLHKVAELMRQRKDEFAELITLGKLVAQAEWEVNLSADILDLRR
jgi:succinate-semialdehyde dehydrogenase/glutarate-semialdehyde dehydrogenase